MHDTFVTSLTWSVHTYILPLTEVVTRLRTEGVTSVLPNAHEMES